MRLSGHSNTVFHATWNGSGTEIASASGDKTAKISSRNTGQCIGTLRGHSNDVHSIVWNSSNTELVTASQDETVKVWSRKGLVCLHTLDHNAPIKTAI